MCSSDLGDGEAGGNRQAEAGHLGEVRPLAAQEVLLILVSLTEAVHVLGHHRLSRISLRGADATSRHATATVM